MLLPFSSLMARSASEGVDTSTKAYPTGRVVRGLVGIDVVSLRYQSVTALSMPRAASANIHKVVLKELLQLSLGGRVSEVSNVKSPALSGAGDDGLVLRGVDRLVAASTDAGAFSGAGRLMEGGVRRLGGGSVGRHSLGWLMTRSVLDLVVAGWSTSLAGSTSCGG